MNGLIFITTLAVCSVQAMQIANVSTNISAMLSFDCYTISHADVSAAHEQTPGPLF